MKINILFEFRTGPWGGGNQFLKALKSEFIRNNQYIDNLENADVILLNSFHFSNNHTLRNLHTLKKDNIIIIHRVDGPIFQVRGKDLLLDKALYHFNSILADGTIFQSNWSREENYKLGMKKNYYETSIFNAPDSKIFNTENKIEFNRERKIKLISTSWSSNFKKGFGIYRYFDNHLDFNRYSMTFVGNSPIEFKNIKHVKAVSSKKLAEILKAHDIYITASKNDPCSNALLEALSCGLPAIALDSGGHREIIGQGGQLFDEATQVIEKIEELAKNYHRCQENIPRHSIAHVAQSYFKFALKIFQDVHNGNYKPKQITLLSQINLYKVQLELLRWNAFNKMNAIIEGSNLLNFGK